MSKIEIDEIEEEPLDPQLEKVRRKMLRLLFISIGIMMVGLMAVLGAIVYQAMSEGRPGEAAAPTAPPAAAGGIGAATVALPAGFTIDHVALDGTRGLFVGTLPGGERRALLVDIGAGRLLGDIGLSERP